MRGFHGAEAMAVGDPSEGDGAGDIGDERPGGAGEEEGCAARPVEGVKLAEEEGKHQGALERADATARFIHTEGAGGEGDEISVRVGLDAEPWEDFDGNPCVALHEPVHPAFLDASQEGDGGAEEEHGKDEMTKP